MPRQAKIGVYLSPHGGVQEADSEDREEFPWPPNDVPGVYFGPRCGACTVHQEKRVRGIPGYSGCSFGKQQNRYARDGKAREATQSPSEVPSFQAKKRT